MVPAPFQSPPPSAAAMFPMTVPPVMLTSPAPVTCSPPPLPGAMLVMLLSRTTFIRVTVVPAPDTSSIPPPALMELLAMIDEFITERVAPASFRIPPPLPLAPSAMLSRIMVLPIMVTTPAALNMPAPPCAAAMPWASLSMIMQPSRKSESPSW